MIYFVASILGRGEWAIRAREWARALYPLADCRLYSTDRQPLQSAILPRYNPTITKEHPNGSSPYDFLLEMATREPKAAHCTIRFGPIQTLMNITDRAPYEIAITDIPENLTGRQRRVLERFDEVWVPTLAMQELYGSGNCVAWAEPHAGGGFWGAIKPLSIDDEGREITAAFGTWEEIEPRAARFFAQHPPDGPHRFLAVCPDCPITTSGQLVKAFGLGDVRLPFSLSPALPTDIETLIAIRKACNNVSEVPRPMGPSYWDRMSCYATPPAWKVRNRLAEIPNDTVEPEPVQASGPASSGTDICYVIPFRDRPRYMLEDCLAAIREGELPKGDRIVVSDQSPEFDPEVLALCAQFDATLVRDMAPPHRWNAAKCRNIGVRACPEADYYALVDVDCTVPPDYGDRIREELAYAPGTPITPMVSDLDEEGAPADSRPAPGCTVYPHHLYWAASGMDEGFERWGSEDMDLLWRLRQGGIEASLLEDVILEHAYHPPQEGKAESGEANLERINRRQRGELGAANPDGWGEGGEVVA